ncbi:Vacuolar protein-sorting-associated protein 60 [Coemansia sp. RSA 989]|nr:Snf7 family [Coemansia mojavensis]KAJ1744429.1 Vacuolar protein-sorting-associated protein 60 [Coemansia sp. RSA 1086]KAJ1753661.1 Vacuolar protein-sorting-associated protein 60 [Coemansia sp. RSA 1821]KAJ1868519.1 Vacuolar protein-sorting-associated protein 60 [Coemansia sp. RSA 989]KAJ1876129.1 Vacuolar protein-sorting-associated protein 60 [Coemansia sp. RSA 990]KAJ2632690.1 Vacuolar protein-sorting-associated protein 60 [Coemansia sp. RSA 1290]KAJ2652360.1 Vacuolar protein-sorting-asso
MNRIFGVSKNKAPKPTLDDAIRSTDARVSSVEVKIKELDGRLAAMTDRMRKMRDGPGKTSAKKQAMQVLQQKKKYEAQRDNLLQQSFNMESTAFAMDNVKNTMTTVQAMQDANKELKKQYKNIDVDKIYDIQDEMSDLMEQANEVQELMGRSYDLPEDFDEEDLEAELDALGDDLNFEEEMPSYLNDTQLDMPELLPEAPDNSLSQPTENVAGPSRTEPALRM